MLTYLKIENLALIEKTEIEFSTGFNVITGETGAGKSILLGAISLLLGERAERTAIRTDAERCEICGIFQLKGAEADDIAPILENADIPFDRENGELQLRRIITHNSGRCHINDTPVTVRLLREIGEYLIDFHSANEHQSLTARGRQLDLLDRYSHADKLKDECNSICEQLELLEKEEAEFAAKLPSSLEAGHLELIIEEINKVSPALGEDDELDSRHKLAANSKQIVEDTNIIVNILTDNENSISDQLTHVYRLLLDLTRIDEKQGEELAKQCEILSESIRELASSVLDFGGNVELDPQAFIELENRLSELYTLKRRYGPDLDTVLKTLEDAQTRLDSYRSGNKRREEFSQKRKELKLKLQDWADALTKLRKNEAGNMTAAVCAKLGAIGFTQGELIAEFGTTEPGRNGQDTLELLFSANPGEAPQPLRKIASSGELSRLMLAMKTVLSDADRIPVAVFDEIDVNIGGETALSVGEELHRLGQRRQLLAISHLPQVAARGDSHFAVTKATNDGRTISTVCKLGNHERELEISRMLGGGTAAKSHAKEILSLT